MSEYTIFVAPHFTDEMIAILQTYADDMFAPKVKIERYKTPPAVPAKKYSGPVKGYRPTYMWIDEWCEENNPIE